MTNFKKYLILIILLVQVGCAAKHLPIPELTSSNYSATSIKLGMSAHSAVIGRAVTEMLKIKQVLFIKLDDIDSDLKETSLYKSNFHHEPFMAELKMDGMEVFLMNIDPGIYAAVGAFAVGYRSEVEYFIYFPEEMIRKTITEVKQDSLSYMGEYKLQTVSSLRQMFKPDEAQSYYYSNLLFPNHSLYQGKGAKKLNLDNRNSLEWYGPLQFHSPGLKKNTTSINGEKEFIKTHISTFRNTPWQAFIENRLDDLEKNRL